MAKLIKRAKELRPRVERDGHGLTELEFALTNLVELDIVPMHVIQPFILQFRALDVRMPLTATRSRRESWR